MPSHADVVIIGGGPVGSTLALSLKDLDLGVVVLEAGRESVRDARTLALSYNSRLILERVGVWQRLARVTAIEEVHVAQRQSFGAARLRSSDLGLPALGYTLGYGDVMQAMQSALAETSAQVYRGAKVLRRERVSRYAVAYFERDGSQHELSTNLVAIADGNTGADARRHDYEAQALVAEVHAETGPAATAFERFRAGGTIALLPKTDSWALIWSMKNADAARFASASDDFFLSELQKYFGDRLGRFIEAKPRASYPLVSRLSSTLTEMRTVRLGNSAQALHPVMAQGLNLGLRDAFELGRVISSTQRQDVGSERMLAQYRARRASDRFAAMAATEAVVQFFSFDSQLLRLASTLGLSALNTLPFAKRFFLRRAIFGS